MLEKGVAPHSSILVEFHGQKKVGYSPWGGKELEMTELLTRYVLEP